MPLKQYSFQDFGAVNGWLDSTDAVLSVDMDNSMCNGEMYLCLQFIDNEHIQQIDSIPLIIIFHSPDSKKFYDTVNFPLKVSRQDGTVVTRGRLKEIQWLYRKNIEVGAPGRWKIVLRHYSKNNSLYKDIIGAGVFFK